MRLLPLLRTTPAIAVLLAPALAAAQFSPIYFDGFDVTESGGTTNGTSTFNINEDLGVPRQGGPLLPISYVTSTADSSNNFGHQLFPPSNGAQPLLLAENGTNPPGVGPVFSYKTMVSPDFNFDGTVEEGIVGKRVTFTLDVGVFAGDAGSGILTQAGITIGAPATLIDSEDQIGVQELLPVRDYFSVHFVEDTFIGNEPFLQAFDGADGGLPIDDIDNSGINVPHGGGTDPLAIQLDIDDPNDGNPWDGVGSTVVDVFVNGALIYSYEKGDGGYTDNYITLFGSRQFAGNQLATHTIENFTVFAAPLVTSVPADYNEDGVVDSLDYAVFRENLGQSVTLPGENPAATTPGLVDEEDLVYWRDNYGGPAGSGAVATPEPMALAIVVCGLVGGVTRRRRVFE